MVTRAISVLGAVALIASLFVAAPAAAGTCSPAGGRPVTRSTTQRGDFVLLGGGFGHGVGMSQWGAKGAASLGCTADQILATYYPGTVLGSSVPSQEDNIRVSLLPVGPAGTLPSAVDVVAVSDKVPWQLGGATRQQPAGRTWRVSVGSAGRYTVKDGTTTIFSAADGPLRVTLNGKIVRLPTKGRRYNRGVLELTWPGSGSRTRLTAVVDGLDKYLYGLAEMYASWPAAALQTQAIAGRSYALQSRQSRTTSSTRWQHCRCDVYDSVADQVYAAYEHESVAPAWRTAVDVTAGRTLRHDGRTVRALYSSSSGGHTESSAFVFGGAQPYHMAVDDSRWERASDNPYSRWVVALDAGKIGSAFGVGTALAVKTPEPKGAAGRIGNPAWGAGGVVIVGTAGTATVSGPEFRFKLGLRSALFRVKTAIAQHYEAIGGPSSFLGRPIAAEHDVRGGRARVYEGGRIYWSPATGAKVVRGKLLDKYLDLGGPDSVLRLPTTSRRKVTGGRAQHFQKGRIYTSAATGPHALTGRILRKYRELSGPDSRLGLPVTDVYDVTVGRRARFQHGRITYNTTTGVVSVRYF